MLLSSRKLPQRTNLLLLVSLFAAEASILFTVLGAYKRQGRPTSEFLATDAGLVFVVSIVVGILSMLVILVHYSRARSVGFREFYFTVAMNLTTVGLACGLAEIGVRLLTRHGGTDETVLGHVLLPRSWNTTVTRHRHLLATGLGHVSYLVYDEALGWTLGSNRKSWNGLYFSSTEGIRAPRPDVSFSVLAHRSRIAVVGDSFTFGEEVLYEDTWAHGLEKELGGSSSVLNFGVPGYGVDQAYLRYGRDVGPWKPDVVILGFISQDVHRSMGVYAFLTFPDFPFSKPRLVLQDENLIALNVPSLAPELIFSKRSLLDLPFLEYDARFKLHEWRRSLLDSIHIVRLLRSAFPPWRNAVEYGDAMVKTNSAIIREFVQSVRDGGAEPLVVFFAAKQEFAPADGEMDARRVMDATGLPYTDLTECLRPLAPDERFMPGNHYTPRANAMIATCLAPVVREALSRKGIRRESRSLADPTPVANTSGRLRTLR